MKCLDFYFDVTELGYEFNFTPLYDLHEDARDCVTALVEQRLRERNELPNHYIFFGGDVFNLIMPKDLKRFRVSTAKPEIATRDDYLNAVLEENEQRWLPYKDRILAIGKGNHEQKAVEYHHYDIVREMARRLGVPTAGYSGMLRFHFMRKEREISPFNWLHHHGIWGGAVVHGMAGATRWLAGFRNWDLCTFGHIHYTDLRYSDTIDWGTATEDVQQTATFLWREGARQRAYERPIVCCGTYLKTYAETDNPDYGEIKGYPPVHLGSPLIRVQILNHADPHTKRFIRCQVITE